MKQNKILNFALPLLTVACILIIWVVSAKIIDNEYILPSVSDTFKAFFALFKSEEFCTAFFGTLLRAFIAFSLSFIIAFILVFLADRFPISKKIINPTMSLLRALPTIAVVLLLLFWTTSNVAPVVVTTLVVLPTTYTNINTAVNTIDKEQIEAAEIDGASKKTVFIQIQFKQMLPDVLVIIGSGLSLNLKLMVAAEVLSQTAYSLGYLLNTSKVYFEVATMLALVTVSVLVGVIIELFFGFLGKKSSNWK